MGDVAVRDQVRDSAGAEPRTAPAALDDAVGGAPAAARRPAIAAFPRAFGVPVRAAIRRPWLLDFAASAAVAGVMRAIFTHAVPASDATYSLIWGRDIVRGDLPDLSYQYAATAHPLANLEAALGALFGQSGAVDLLVTVSYICLGALLWGTFRLGEAACSRAVALVAVVLVGTSYTVLNTTLNAYLDLPFLALVTWAAVLELRQSRRETVLILLAVAGLLRPEAWVLAAAYWLYRFRRQAGRLRAAVIVAAAPLVWVLMGLIVTGDPLFSVSSNRQTAVRALGGAHTGASNYFSTAVSQLRSELRAPVLIVAALGLLLAIRTRPKRLKVPASILVIVVGVFLGFEALGLAVPDRMLLLPAVMLTLFSGYAMFGWREQRGVLGRRLWAAVGIAALIVVSATLPHQFSRLSATNGRVADQQRVLADLRGIGRLQPAAEAIASCPPVWVARPETVAYIAYYLDVPLRSIRVAPALGPAPSRGTYVVPASPAVAALIVGHSKPEQATTVAPGFATVARQRSWIVYSRACVR